MPELPEVERINTIIFDFDGVLSHDKFYGEELREKHPKVHQWVQDNIFGSDRKLSDDWKRGKLTSEDINKIISDNTDIDFTILNDLHRKGVLAMKLDTRVVDLVKRLRSQHKLCLVTDNMDVLTSITIKNHSLDKLFDAIINSADHGYLKKDSDGKLYDIALNKIGADIKRTFLIDDSPKAVKLFTEKGGNAFLYKNFDELELFLKENKI